MNPEVQEAPKKKRAPLFFGREAAPVWLRPLGAALACLGTAGFAFVIYLRTLAPGVLPYDRPAMLDSAMLQTQVATLGMTHPTGYPTYVMLGHLFTYLPVGDAAYRVNLFSAVVGVLAVALLFLIGYRLSGSVLAAVVGSLTFAMGDTYWSQNIIAEVYTLNVAFICIVLLALVLWRDSGRDRYLLGAAFFMGLSLTHHVTTGLMLPAAALFVAMVDWRRLLDWRLILKGAGLFVLGLTPYLYLPIRAAMNPPMNEADPTTFARFWQLVNGGELTGSFGQFGPGQLPMRLSAFGAYMADEIYLPLLFVAALGVFVALWKQREVAVLLGSLFIGWLVYALEYSIFDYFLYFIPVYLILALFIAMGTGAILGAIDKLMLGNPFVLRAAAILLFFAPLIYFAAGDVRADYRYVDMSGETKGRRIIETVAAKAKPGATVLHHRSSLWYMVLVEKRRRDLTLVSPWYPAWKRHTDLVWPDDIDAATANIRWGTNDYSGVAAAREARKEGKPVYIIDQESAFPSYFREGGFYFARVEKGLLYELVPVGKRPYTSLEEQQD